MDPYSEYWSRSRKLLNSDPIRIRIHNTEYRYRCSYNTYLYRYRSKRWCSALVRNVTNGSGDNSFIYISLLSVQYCSSLWLRLFATPSPVCRATWVTVRVGGPCGSCWRMPMSSSSMASHTLTSRGGSQACSREKTPIEVSVPGATEDYLLKFKCLYFLFLSKVVFQIRIYFASWFGSGTTPVLYSCIRFHIRNADPSTKNLQKKQ